MKPTTVRARRRGVGPRDEGVTQSAFVAMLIVVVLVFTSAIVALGPQIGGSVAARFICALLSDTGCGSVGVIPAQPGPPSGVVPASGVGVQPAGDQPGDGGPDKNFGTASPSAAASPPDGAPKVGGAGPSGGDTTGTTAAVVDLGQGCSQEAVNALAQTLPGGGWSADDLVKLGRDVPLGVKPNVHVAGSLGGTWQIVDCRLTFKLDQDYSHPDEARTDVTWGDIARTTAAGAVGVAAGAVVGVACYAIPALVALCPSLIGFAVGFFWNLAGAAMTDGQIDGKAVLKAFIAGIFSAVPGAIGPLVPRLGAQLNGLLILVADKVSSVSASLWAWVRNIVGAGLDTVADWARQAANYFERNPLTRPSPGPPGGPA